MSAKDHFPYTRDEYLVMVASGAWAVLISDYIRSMLFSGRNSEGEGEALIAFGIYFVLMWWLSERIGKGWSPYWFAGTLASFALFADIIDGAFGGVLGLRG